MTRYKDYYTKPDIIEQLYYLMFHTNNLLLQFNVPYFIDGGTLLGAVRHGGIIRIDNDLDICISAKDIDTILSPKFKKECKKYKIKIKNLLTKSGWLKLHYKKVDVDLFVMEVGKRNGADVLLHMDKKVREYWPKCVYKVKDVFPLKEVKFSNFTVLAPRNPKPYLNSCYGKSWSKKMIFTQDPETHYELDEPIVIEGVKNFKAARPFYKYKKSELTTIRKDNPLLCSWKTNCK